tara:strand:+ start:331 stop:894 length:564 start_codon:yes stop_codon:yes gene_type:complete
MLNHLVTPEYKLFIQKKVFCGPACLQMILDRHGIRVDQEQLAYDVGLRITAGDEDKYSFPFSQLPEDDERIGLVLADFEGEQLQTVLRKYQLRSQTHLIGSIKDPERFLCRNIQEDNDVIANFWVDNGKHYGHFVLVSGYNNQTKEVNILDPLYDVKNRYGLSLDTLVKGMSSQWTGRERGFAVIGD